MFLKPKNHLWSFIEDGDQFFISKFNAGNKEIEFLSLSTSLDEDDISTTLGVSQGNFTNYLEGFQSETVTIQP